MGKVKVTIAMPAYGEVSHDVISSLVDAVLNLGNCGKYEIVFAMASNTLICSARKALVERAVERGSEYLVFLDADVIHQAGDIQKLLDTAIGHQFEILSGLYCMRGEPHLPLIGEFCGETHSDGMEFSVPRAHTDILQCDAIGFGFCCLDLKIFEKIPQPWFILEEVVTEDFVFCRKAKEYGIKVFVDTSICLLHEGQPVLIAPSIDDTSARMAGRQYIFAKKYAEENHNVNKGQEGRKIQRKEDAMAVCVDEGGEEA